MENTNDLEIVEEKTKEGLFSRLDKSGKIILFVSWALALLFIVIGLINIIGGSKIKLELNESYSFERLDEGETYYFTFTPEESGEYRINIRFGTLIDVTSKDNGSESWSYTDFSYETYLYESHGTCIIEVFVEDREGSIRISRNYDY